MTMTTTVMRFHVNPAIYNRSIIVQNEKRNKYAYLHKKIKHQSKLFRKKYEIEQSLELKEKKVTEQCNIFRNKHDDECMTLFDEIEQLEQRLKAVQKKLENTKTKY